MITLTLGISASGKTTWAEEVCKATGAVNVNRDDARQELFGPFKWGEYEFTQGNEKAVTRLCKERALVAILQGKDIIVSDTNLSHQTRETWEAIAKENNVSLTYKVFNILLKEAVERDSNREMSVGKKVLSRQILKMHSECKDIIINDFKQRLEEQWERGGTPCIVSDIDSTVAEMHKDVPGKRKPYDWKRVGEDTPRENVLTSVRMWGSNNHNVVFLSGRDGICYPETLQWLNEHYSGAFDLYMRQASDQRPDWVIKLELLEVLNQVGFAKPTLMFDDRNQVVDTFREVGLEVFQVQPGNF